MRVSLSILLCCELIFSSVNLLLGLYSLIIVFFVVFFFLSHSGLVVIEEVVQSFNS